MKISVANQNGELTYVEKITSNRRSNDTNVENFDDVYKQTTVASKLNTVTTYKDIFLEASQKYGVSYNLLTAMAQQESGFNPNATSRSGAMGIMQLMPATAAGLGVSNAYDPYENIMGGAKYISDKLAMYNGDIDLALAAYNAGSGAVAKYGGIPPYAETQNYVKNIRAIMERGADVPDKNYIYKNASKEAMEADLKFLLSELPDTEEFAPLRNILAEMNYL